MGCAASKKAVEPGGVWPQEPKSPAVKSAGGDYASPKTAEGDEPMPERPSQIARQASDFRRRRLSHGMAEPDTAADAAAAADALAAARRISEEASARNAKHTELRREASRLSGEMTASGEMTRPSPETSFTSVDPS